MAEGEKPPELPLLHPEESADEAQKDVAMKAASGSGEAAASSPKTQEKRKRTDDEGEEADPDLTVEEKRARGIATLASPERSDEKAGDGEGDGSVAPSSPAMDLAEGDGKTGPAKELWEKDLKEFWDEAGGKDGTEWKEGDGDDWWNKDASWSKPAHAETEKPPSKSGSKAAESEDDWGLEFRSEASKKEGSLMEEIRKQREEGAGFEQEKWAPPETEAEEEEEKQANDEDDWKGLFGHVVEENVAEDEDYWYNDTGPDVEWIEVECNSAEALSGTVLVQKIRSRAAKDTLQGGAFPNLEASKLFASTFQTQPQHEQKMLLAALLWIEATTVEVKVVPPDLSEAFLLLLKTEASTLRAVCDVVPNTAMRTRGSSKLPTREIRKNSDNTVEKLIGILHELLPEDMVEIEDLTSLVQEELGTVPATIRVSALIHCVELARLRGKRCFKSLDNLIITLAKQRLPSRAIETVCRLTLSQSMDLVKEWNKPSVMELREQKLKVLKRLHRDWNLKPSEEQLAQVHMYNMETQVTHLLNVERDIEEHWVKTLGRVKGEDARNKEMATYLTWANLIKPYQLGKVTRAVPIHEESGVKLGTIMLGKIRSATTEVLKLLSSRYKWVPDVPTRMSIAETNWPARLYSLLTLATMPDCLHADAELRRMLNRDAHQQIGGDVLKRFDQWAQLEEGEGVVIKASKIADEAAAVENRKLYKDFVPDPTKRLGAAGYLPMTPGALGNVMAMPMTPGMFAAPGTPGAAMRAAGTPRGPPPAGNYFGSAPMTPSGALPGTPSGRVPGTPGGPPPATPGAFHSFISVPMTPSGALPAPMTPSGALPGTPSGRVVPSTPGGPPPATPGFGYAPGTPAGPPPMTPGMPGMKPPGTPAGPPF